MRKGIMLALAATVVTSIAAPSAAYYLSKPDDDALGSTLRGYGFLPIQPPSNLMNVGSLYYVDSAARTFRAICEVTKADIEGAVITSRSWDVRENLERNGHFTTGVTVDLGSLFGGGGDDDNHYVEKVHSSLTDIVIEELPLGASWLIFAKIMEKPECSKIAKEFVSGDGYVCQGQMLLQATAEFKLDLDAQNKLGTKAKVSADNVKDAVKLAVEAQSDQTVVERSGRLFSGSALQYGVSMNPTCLAPPTARFRRVLPRSAWDRFVNFVLLDIVEPLLPAEADQTEVADARAAK